MKRSALLVFITLNAFALIGGEKVTKHKYPNIIQYEFQSLSGQEKVCTGVFVSSNTILTAGHCLVDIVECEPQKILKSSIKVYLTLDDGEKKEIEGISHFEYNPDLLEPHSLNEKGKCTRRQNPRYDLGYIVLKKKVELKARKISFDFATSHDSLERKIKYQSIGFGHSVITEMESQAIKYFYEYSSPIDMIGQKQVGTFFLVKQSKFYPLQTQETNYLMGKKYSSKSSQLQPGDSGGPLINSKGEVVGISSQYKLHDIKAEGLDFVKGYKVESFFTPLHRQENKKFLEGARIHGSDF